MKILAFDSTAKIASVAVLENERVLASYHIDNGLTQSELLLPMAEDILKALRLELSDIELFACSTGPGSFTGVRIGAALVKGLAFGKNIPCASVDTLEALAESLSGIRGLIVPVMDARRGQYYTALFSGGNGIERLTADEALDAKALAEKIALYKKGLPVYLVGDGYKNALSALEALGVACMRTPELLLYENAASVGRVAYRMQKAGLTVTDSDISATYLRLPQAERERLARLEGASEG